MLSGRAGSMVSPEEPMKSYAFLWTCPACGEYVRTDLPPREEDAALVCAACGSVFGEKVAAPEGEPSTASA